MKFQSLSFHSTILVHHATPPRGGLRNDLKAFGKSTISVIICSYLVLTMLAALYRSSRGSRRPSRVEDHGKIGSSGGTSELFHPFFDTRSTGSEPFAYKIEQVRPVKSIHNWTKTMMSATATTDRCYRACPDRQNLPETMLPDPSSRRSPPRMVGHRRSAMTSLDKRYERDFLIRVTLEPKACHNL